MKYVGQILDQKGHDVWIAAPSDTVREALATMAERNVGALVVTQDEQVIGVISERDYARKVIIKGKSSLETRVEDIMALAPTCVSPDTAIDECMTIMTEKHVRHLPVLDGADLVGLVSIGDVVKTIISECQAKVGELEGYIYGS
jgi:CBS domain-containing protein